MLPALESLNLMSGNTGYGSSEAGGRGAKNGNSWPELLGTGFKVHTAEDLWFSLPGTSDPLFLETSPELPSTGFTVPALEALISADFLPGQS